LCDVFLPSELNFQFYCEISIFYSIIFVSLTAYPIDFSFYLCLSNVICIFFSFPVLSKSNIATLGKTLSNFVQLDFMISLCVFLYFYFIYSQNYLIFTNVIYVFTYCSNLRLVRQAKISYYIVAYKLSEVSIFNVTPYT
jgi:hypothetical protein